MADLHAFHGPNAGYVLDLFDRYRTDPESVDPSWRTFFDGIDGEPDLAAEQASAPEGGGQAAPVLRLAQAIRRYGHTAADLDPLGQGTEADPSLDLDFHGLTPSSLRAEPAAAVGGPASRSGSAEDAIRRLREVYTGTIGYEFEHVVDAEERDWLRDAVESDRVSGPLDDDARRTLLQRLSEVEGFERYLHRAFFGQKRFSIEGNDALVPVLDTLVEQAAASGSQDVVIGMAHRGRLNVLAHVMEKPYELMVGGFMGRSPALDDGRTGDVKYHMGWEGKHEVGDGHIAVRLAPNPSHLEFVNPVVVGMARAAQTRTDRSGPPAVDLTTSLPILVHGDAAFPGQGVVAETFNFSRLPGYTVGGTVHVIANNQIGFTTDPGQGRSTRYASDLAKGFEVPVVHVNADDVEACLSVARLASAYRVRYHKDFVIDLIGYRRWGHNEGDEPAFTQPVLYDAIGNHPTARARYAERLVGDGILSESEAEEMLEGVMARMDAAKAKLEEGDFEVKPPSENGRRSPREMDPGVDVERLVAVNEALLDWPEGFEPNARLAKLLRRRGDALEGEPAIDWGHAETLAFASLLEDGVSIRLTGQDAQRGTFSHRHAVLHDQESGRVHTPLASFPEAKASFEIHNSPLSEMAVVGFEYGYSVSRPDALVLWEAQFGDFVNGAQVMIDQFISAGYAKWGQTNGLVMLLPHGYEGQGPEHSSARLERFLQLAAERNLRVANCTTSAQYFHLLRRQAALLDEEPQPLVVMSPKSLLRHPMAASTLEDLTDRTFRTVIPDESAAERAEKVTRLALCSGKVYVDLAGSDDREKAERVALARVEELYPLPEEALREVVGGHPELREIVWVQEEPKNMGAWSYMEPRLRALAPDGIPVRYIGRPERASPAEGYAPAHNEEQARIVRETWAKAPTGRKKSARSSKTKSKA